MTRSCPACSNGSGSKYTSTAHLRGSSGGVAKNYRPSSPGRSFKMYTKAQSKAVCLQTLKDLLPRARHQQVSSELELVRETIAYISHLENMLRPSSSASDQQQPQVSAMEDTQSQQEEQESIQLEQPATSLISSSGTVAAAAAMLQNMTV